MTTTTSTAHRALKIGDHGPDVIALQHAINDRWTPRHGFPVAVDGAYGEQCARNVAALSWLLGAADNTIADNRRGASIGEQAIILNPEGRTAEQSARSKTRQDVAHVQERAIQYALNACGLDEVGGNNRGPRVEAIIHYAGGDIGEPWCVDQMIWCYGRAGSAIVKPGFPRAVSKMHTAGTNVVADPKPGDLIRYRFDHTGMFIADNGNGTLLAIEGNTGNSGAVSDSADGHDGCKLKTRSFADVRDFLHVTK